MLVRASPYAAEQTEAVRIAVGQPGANGMELRHISERFRATASSGRSRFPPSARSRNYRRLLAERDGGWMHLFQAERQLLHGLRSARVLQAFGEKQNRNPILTYLDVDFTVLFKRCISISVGNPWEKKKDLRVFMTQTCCHLLFERQVNNVSL